MEEQDKAAATKKLQKSYFDVLGICCSSEIPLVENILKQLDGVKDVSVIVASRTVIVVHDSLLVSSAQIVSALNQARLEANVKMRGDDNHKMKWPSPYAVASGVLLLLSLLKYAYRPLEWIAIGAVAVGIFPIIFRAMTAIRNMRLDINVLAIIAVAGTISMRDYLEAATIVFLFSIAEWLQSMASHKARAAMSSLMSIAPQKATIAETGEEVDVDDVKLNTILAVKAGEVIPIDGIVVDGKSEVDEKTLTGESFPVCKEKDSSVWAGTINLNGYLSVKTTAMAEDCVVAKMAKLVEEAQNKKSKTQKIVDRFAQYYTPAIMIVFLCVLVIPVALRVRNRDYWIKLALVILVSGCPCALVLSTPVATFCALTKAAKSGLLIKGGDYLETLAKVKTVAFDKTGTVTKGEFVVAEFKVLSTEVSQETLLYWVSSIESKSSHPLAASIVHYGMSLGIVSKPEYVEDFQNFPGEGIYGRIDGRDLFIGNKKIASRAGNQTVPDFDGENAMGGKTVGYIYLGSDLVGAFSLSDECRTGVIEAIRELKSKNIRTVMLTGDCLAAAMNAQNQLSGTLDQVYAELLPEDKSRIIQQLKENGRTAMVGDGINDAPALASSDIGISMGISGSALATETGHVILMSNDIRKIPKAINLAVRARRKIIENVLLSFSTRLAILGLAIAKHPLVWAAVLADTGTCILVIMNSMLLLGGRHKHQHLEKCSRKACGDEKEQKCSTHKISSGQNRHQCCSKKSHGTADSPHVHTDHHSEQKNMARQSCCEPKSKAQQSCCEPKSKAQQSCCEPKTKAQQSCCELKSKAQQKCCQPKSGARKNCCEPTKPSCAAEEVPCEPRNCSSKCSHPSQPTVSLGEITEIPNLDRKHGCCSGNNTVKCEPGAASHDSGNRCSKFSNNHDHVANASKVNVHRCSPTGQNTKKDNCCANDLEKNIHGSNWKSTCDQTRCCNEQKNECRSQACGKLGVHDHCDQDHKSWREPDPDVTNMARITHSACCSLEKREIARCCQSYMKECCKSHQGHLHPGFGGSLTEIIIE